MEKIKKWNIQDLQYTTKSQLFNFAFDNFVAIFASIMTKEQIEQYLTSHNGQIASKNFVNKCKRGAIFGVCCKAFNGKSTQWRIYSVGHDTILNITMFASHLGFKLSANNGVIVKGAWQDSFHRLTAEMLQILKYYGYDVNERLIEKRFEFINVF